MDRHGWIIHSIHHRVLIFVFPPKHNDLTLSYVALFKKVVSTTT